MKPTSSRLPITALSLAAILFAGQAFGQPGVINPLTGQPAPSSARPGGPITTAGSATGINPYTGLPSSNANEPTPGAALTAAFETVSDVHNLISSGQYDEALQRCLAFHDQFKTAGSLNPLLLEWAELGRRFPRAKAALIRIRDYDAGEFSAGRGYLDLFREVHAINASLQQDEATYDLYKSFREKDADLARQCYSVAEALMIAKADYQWCYDHMGDAAERFDSFHQSLTRQLDLQKQMAARNEATRQRIAEINAQHGLTNLPAFSPPDTSALMKKSAENSFVRQTRQLIEILVATGHQADAEKIRDRAVAVLDDDLLKSVVADAEAKTKK